MGPEYPVFESPSGTAGTDADTDGRGSDQEIESRSLSHAGSFHSLRAEGVESRCALLSELLRLVFLTCSRRFSSRSHSHVSFRFCRGPDLPSVLALL